MIADEVWKFLVSAGVNDEEKWWGKGFDERRSLEKVEQQVRGTTKKVIVT